jgi:LysM repeat protein
MRIQGPQPPIIPSGGQENKVEVQQGDTLQSIADKFNINAGDLAKANGLSSDSSLSPGMQLLLPAVHVADGQASGLGGVADQAESATGSPGETLAMNFADQYPEATKKPGEDIGIRFHDQMPQGVRPGEDLGIRFHDQMPINLNSQMLDSDLAGNMLVNNQELARAFGSLGPQENIGIRFHDKMPEAGKQAELGSRGPEDIGIRFHDQTQQSELGSRGPEDIGIRFHDQIPGAEGGAESAQVGFLPNLRSDMFEVTDQGQLLIKNEDLAKAFRSILDSTQGSTTIQLVALPTKTEE